MIVIRKFVIGAGAAGLLAAGALLLFGQTGVAATRTFDASSSPAEVTTPAPSGACAAAIQAIKTAVVADRSEDAAERHAAKAEGPDAKEDAEDAADRSEDSAELAGFRSLFGAARTACAPAVPATFKPAPSAACTAAVQAVKADLAQGRPSTRAQWQQLASLFQAARTACGFTWNR
jgi:hypothetical protein